MEAVMPFRRRLALISVALLPLTALNAAQAPAASHDPPARAESVSTLLDWQRIAIDTIFVDGRIVLAPAPDPPPAAAAVPVPVGTLFLGYTALAVDDAVQRAGHRRHASSGAAIATAAHDVLAHYLPNTQTKLDEALEATLAGIPDSRAERRGMRVGHRAAARLIASRVDDGFGDPQWVYALDASQPGIFKPVAPPPAGGMLAPWLGHVDPLVLPRNVRVDGPPALTSSEWVRNFNEAKRTGSATATGPRVAHRQAVADFFFVNSVVAQERALVEYLRTHPLRLERAARMFAVMNASMADAVRNIWRLKLEVGFWRPAEAIVRAAEDPLDATVADPAWRPFRPTPPYSEYASGHAVVTGTFAHAARMFLGNDVPLTLVSVPVAPPGVTPPDRSYATLSALEHDAFMARIWAGIHFRDAMEDGYSIAHTTVRRVERILDRDDRCR
jgi:hypothetical protein